MAKVPVARALRFLIIGAITALALSGCMQTVGPVARVPVGRALRLPIIAPIAALPLSVCMQTVGPVAVAPSPRDLDSFAYGRPYAYAQPYRTAAANGLASSPSQAYAATRVAYAAPMPAAHDAAYRLD